MSGVCPECEACVKIKETGIQIGSWGTATYKEILPHPDARLTVPGVIVVEIQCLGTGRRV